MNNRTRQNLFPMLLLPLAIATGCAAPPDGHASVRRKDYRESLPANGKIADIAMRNHHLLVYAYGGELYREGPGVVRGKGVSVLLADNFGRVVTRLEWPASSGGDLVIDSTAASAGVLKLTTYAADASAEGSGQSALVETTLVSRLDGSADVSRRVLVVGEDLDVAAVTRLCRLAVATASNTDDFWRLIHRLRNFGGRHPDIAVEALRAIQERVNGTLARGIGACIGEVDQLRDARAVPPAAIAMR